MQIKELTKCFEPLKNLRTKFVPLNILYVIATPVIYKLLPRLYFYVPEWLPLGKSCSLS